MNYTTLQTLTVGQYQEIFAIQTSKMDDTDKLVQSVCVLTGLTEREVDELSLGDFNKVAHELTVIFSADLPDHKPPRYLKLKGKTYGITYNPRNLAYYQYADIQAWIQKSTIENMHRVVASLIYPIKRYWVFQRKLKNDPGKHPELSEAALECKYLDVHAICVFFSLLWNNSIKALASCLEKQTRETLTQSQRQEMKKLLQAVSDGSITQSR
jgi:hypothetical protein